MNGMNFIARKSITAFGALIAIGAGGHGCCDRYLAPSTSASNIEVNGRRIAAPGSAVVASAPHHEWLNGAKPNATLRSLEETVSSPKSTGTGPMFGGYRRSREGGFQVAAVLYTPKWRRSCRGQAQLASSKGRGSARAATWTTTRQTYVQGSFVEGRGREDRLGTLDQRSVSIWRCVHKRRSHGDSRRCDATRALAATAVDSPPAPVRDQALSRLSQDRSSVCGDVVPRWVNRGD